jgi:hypothetical protein
MTESDKAAERSTLTLQLGRLFAPIHVVKKPTPPTSTEYQVAAARFTPDLERWEVKAHRFVIVSGVEFGHELDDITRGPREVWMSLARLAKDTALDPAAKQLQLSALLNQYETQTITAIHQVPIEWSARLLDEQTPFSTYLKIHDAIGTARHRLHYFDRYLDSDFYRLYLRDIDRALEIRLVTTKGNTNYGVVNVLAVSRLAAQEFSNYQLRECSPSDMHDRNLRIDDMIFFLGASVKEAGSYPMNFSPSDSTPHGHQVLDGILAKGVVVK